MAVALTNMVLSIEASLRKASNFIELRTFVLSPISTKLRFLWAIGLSKPILCCDDRFFWSYYARLLCVARPPGSVSIELRLFLYPSRCPLPYNVLFRFILLLSSPSALISLRSLVKLILRIWALSTGRLSSFLAFEECNIRPMVVL